MPPKKSKTPATSALKVHLLDMGHEKYGDSILCQAGNRTILIDGGHRRDWQSHDGMLSITEQLRRLLGHAPPFAIDLLVVTHCHADHIGCLPTLIENTTVKAPWALVADEKLGFGRADDHVPPGMPTPADRVAAMLREEDHGRLSDEELADFLQDAANLEQRYTQMLDALKQRGTRVVRYGRNQHRPVEEAFRSFGLKILGPSTTQLRKCADAIALFNDSAPDYLADVANIDDSGALVSLYRRILAESDAGPAGAEDRPGKGAALNNQSIVLKLDVAGATALLTGDMQFAKAEVSGVSPLMTALRQKVRQAAPYAFAKLAHHASYNGFDASVLAEWASTASYAHSGGSNDANHPDAGVLQLLEDNSNRLTWARTDRNGRITVTFSGGKAGLSISKGTLNDAVPNTDVSLPRVGELATIPTAAPAGSVTVTAETGDMTLQEVRWKASGLSLEYALSAPAATAETPPPRRDRSVVERATAAAPWGRLAGGRTLPPLLFITYRTRLENNIGAQEAARAIRLIRDAGQMVHETKNANNPHPEVRKHLATGKYKGVVILGGYDALPAQRLDTLPPSLRQALGQNTSDGDNFIVWNDEAYGDVRGDSLPEFPVSRIPDAKSPRLVKAALGATRATPGTARFGVRNLARPFAQQPYGLLSGTTSLLISERTTPNDIGAGRATGDCVYLMLHGSDVDATRFWGESAVGTLEAVNLTNVPHKTAGIVFTGCCWGALTVLPIASQAAPNQPLGIRTTNTSIALSYLHAGSLAFVGCTGSHYSPTVKPYNYFGGPMHVAFLQRCAQGTAPAQALFDAKMEYIQGMPHGQTSAVGQAVEFKILKQFTCLGLGW